MVNSANEFYLRNKLSRSSKSRPKTSSRLINEKILEPHLLFKSARKLSLRSDDFFLFEYIEKDPLILSSLGMGSRLERVIFPSRVAYHVLGKVNRRKEAQVQVRNRDGQKEKKEEGILTPGTEKAR